MMIAIVVFSLKIIETGRNKSWKMSKYQTSLTTLLLTLIELIKIKKLENSNKIATKRSLTFYNSK